MLSSLWSPCFRDPLPLNFQLSQHRKSVSLLPVIHAAPVCGIHSFEKAETVTVLLGAPWLWSLLTFPGSLGIPLQAQFSSQPGHFYLGLSLTPLCSVLASRISLLNFKFSSNPELSPLAPQHGKASHFPTLVVENPQARKPQAPNSKPL